MKNIQTKNGITLTSLVIYVILFFGFTVFVTNISSNMNQKLFEQRGLAVNISNLNKIEYNLFVSSSNSNSIFIDENKISFSNGDTYEYNQDKRTIYKNSGILCTNISGLTFTENPTEDAIRIDMNLELTRYLSKIQREIILLVEDNI